MRREEYISRPLRGFVQFFDDFIKTEKKRDFLREESGGKEKERTHKHKAGHDVLGVHGQCEAWQ